MQATYTLTWEEFAELFTDSWPCPDYFSTIVVAMVSVPLIGYGITLLTFGTMRDENMLNFMFIGAPVFMLLTAMFALHSQSRKALKQARAEKRIEFDRWHSTEQSFLFDQEKWVHNSEAGRQEIPWPALLKAVEWPSVLYLVAESGSVVVAKRILDPAALDSIRQLAFPAGTRWPFQVSAWDYQATEIAQLWRRYWPGLVLANALGLGLLGWVAQNWVKSQTRTDVVLGWILASLAVILALTARFGICR